MLAMALDSRLRGNDGGGGLLLVMAWDSRLCGNDGETVCGCLCIYLFP